MKTTNLLFIILIIILLPIIILFLIRAFSEKQLDDVSPEIPCEPELLNKADVFYIIPKFNNKSIAENKEWCKEILKLNKKLALHGIYHTYHEFLTTKNQDYFQEGVTLFEHCFNQKPKTFKPPQLKISKTNKQLIKKSGMKLHTYFNQITHKVYHCNDSGKFPNWVVDLI